MATKAKLYTVFIQQTDAELDGQFSLEQRKITSGVKAAINRVLKKKSLTNEFASVSKRVPAAAVEFKAYATNKAVKALKKNIANISAIVKNA